MRITAEVAGRSIELECFDNWLSRWISEAVLSGETYPHFPFVDDVRVVVDVGANCGAASVYFASTYPEATVYALEPGSAPFALLEANATPFDNIRVFNLGLHERDLEVPLYLGSFDSGTASIHPGTNTAPASEPVTLRAADAWLAEAGLTGIDILKIDTEGCEAPILSALGRWLPDVKIVYLEYHAEADRKWFDELLGDTHMLVFGRLIFDTGEVAYVNRGVLPDLRTLDVSPFALKLMSGPGGNRAG